MVLAEKGLWGTQIVLLWNNNIKKLKIVLLANFVKSHTDSLLSHLTATHFISHLSWKWSQALQVC